MMTRENNTVFGVKGADPKTALMVAFPEFRKDIHIQPAKLPTDKGYEIYGLCIHDITLLVWKKDGGEYTCKIQAW